MGISLNFSNFAWFNWEKTFIINCYERTGNICYNHCCTSSFWRRKIPDIAKTIGKRNARF